MGWLPGQQANQRGKDVEAALQRTLIGGSRNGSGSAGGASGTQTIVVSVTQDPATKVITVETKTITYKNGLITGMV